MNARRQDGFVLVGVLAALALVALAAVNTAQSLADARRREAEEQLLFVGREYRAAIESYWLGSPGAVKTLPARAEDLLLDPRYPQPRRHLRKLYADPLDPARPLAFVRQGPALLGVYSQAPGRPFRQTGFLAAESAFEGARSYAEWRFTFTPPVRTSPQTPNTKSKP